MIKRIIGALYGIFLEEPLDRLHNWQKRFEKEYLNYCRTGCKNCYKWNGYCRSQASGTPYKKFRRKYHDMSKYHIKEMIIVNKYFWECEGKEWYL